MFEENLKQPIKNNNHAIINEVPPIGATIPNAVMPVNAIAYKLPAKHTMPSVKSALAMKK